MIKQIKSIKEIIDKTKKRVYEKGDKIIFLSEEDERYEEEKSKDPKRDCKAKG